MVPRVRQWVDERASTLAIRLKYRRHEWEREEYRMLMDKIAPTFFLPADEESRPISNSAHPVGGFTEKPLAAHAEHWNCHTSCCEWPRTEAPYRISRSTITTSRH